MSLPWDIVWFYNSISGAVFSQPALGDTIAAHAPGDHGPFSSKAQALNFYALNKAHQPGWAAPSGLAKNVENTATGAANDAVQGVAGTLINFIKQGSIWERGAEVIVGILILYIGVKAIATPGGASIPGRGVKDTGGSIAGLLKGGTAKRVVKASAKRTAEAAVV